MGAAKVREDRLRRKLDRTGYRLTKSGARDPDNTTVRRYLIVDIQRNVAVAGYRGDAHLDMRLEVRAVGFYGVPF